MKEIAKESGMEQRKTDFVRLSPDCRDRSCFEKINEEAFPLSERWSFAEIFGFAADTDTDILGIYDEETPVGFAVLLKNRACVYLYYLAIDGRMRSKGYGSAVLQKLQETYSGLQLILDFEVIDEAAENREQRIRRKQFYLRNGFHETGSYTMLGDGVFEVVCNGGELLKPAFRELLSILHRYRPEFPELLLESADEISGSG